MMVKFKDDNARLKDEFDTKIDCRLQFILLNLATYVYERFKKQVVVTCLIRTGAENAATAGSNPQSAHLRGDAADIRSFIYSEEEIQEIIAYLKHHWGPMIHAIFHNPGGNGPHIHININYAYSAKTYPVN